MDATEVSLILVVVLEAGAEIMGLWGTIPPNHRTFYLPL